MNLLVRLNNAHIIALIMQNSPIELGEFDHYTLIVDDARAVAEFHVNVLGFRPARVQLVNAGSVPEGEYDMLNHILWVTWFCRKGNGCNGGIDRGFNISSLLVEIWSRCPPRCIHSRKY